MVVRNVRIIVKYVCVRNVFVKNIYAPYATTLYIASLSAYNKKGYSNMRNNIDVVNKMKKRRAYMCEYIV
jgi:hypothetical protein